ncbi:3-hydroxyanthranilate 3,4-dioxygenase [Strongyloides ratti]|uniref:3-hydroxyanthranilate 3,4-dioxygenase n=1 Tax=Strongyloides ratti TaxID=34506 RepID=A0A090MZK9_STRRB|nr:3-hydroxyanthranilate 3,4-dioxygenase [Strongyloides ratti]CEF69114.1 3-hydroxyanthranilate 3,4-dioxygenase [Strongyloides ratti]
MIAISENVEKWCVENEKNFKPPVCNKCMFDKYLKVFFVGGPNQRKDYHIEEGEEFFYQMKGDMVLKLILNGKPYDLVIPEGHIFMLPAKMEHSPQRFENTLGMVIERERLETEFDCVRYFTSDECDSILFERWFHLKDVVKDLPPIIKEFMESEEKKNMKVGEKSFLCQPKYNVVCQDIEKPQNIFQLIKKYENDLENGKEIVLFGKPKYRSIVKLYGKGRHNTKHNHAKELFIYVLCGKAIIDSKEYHKNDAIRIINETTTTFDLTTSSVVLTLMM